MFERQQLLACQEGAVEFSGVDGLKDVDAMLQRLGIADGIDEFADALHELRLQGFVADAAMQTLAATAKQMPCAPMIIAVLMPMTSPLDETSGPPELPGFSAASV